MLFLSPVSSLWCVGDDDVMPSALCPALLHPAPTLSYYTIHGHACSASSILLQMFIIRNLHLSEAFPSTLFPHFLNIPHNECSGSRIP